jgi:L-2-hydroxyglutarate oxidase LhgO
MAGSEKIDCAVIGAGVVGLAVARALALAGREVIVLEAADAIGTGISSRNSEVLHAGIYYTTGSLKARLCVAGQRQLYRYCAERAIEHRRVGKLFVATSSAEVPVLAKYQALARANGVEDLRQLTLAEAAALEPEVHCVAALWSPSTGIIDSHGLMLSFQADLEAHQGILARGAPVRGGAVHCRGITLEVGGTTAMSLLANSVVNCAGLDAQHVSHCLQGVPAQSIPQRFLAKGNYFSLSGRSPFRHLIYPVPNSAGLGTHVTLDLSGNARFGPDVQWVEDIEYSVDEQRRAQFAAAIRLYYPQLNIERLQPAYCGMRPKISAPGQPAGDFCIRGPADHDGCRYVALYGIESPGLTSSMAIAEHVTTLLC